MKFLLMIFLYVGMGNTQSYYRVEPSAFLTEYIEKFRVEYEIDPASAVLIDFWQEDSLTFYKGSFTSFRDCRATKRNMVLAEKRINTQFCRTTGCKYRRVKNQPVVMDEMKSFVLCFHKDNSICELYSYEISPVYNIPVLRYFEDLHRINVPEIDPDIDRTLFWVDKKAVTLKPEKDISFELSRILHENGINDNNRSIIQLSISVDKSGHAIPKEVMPLFEGECDEEDVIIQTLMEYIENMSFVPASHRGAVVNSVVNITLSY